MKTRLWIGTSGFQYPEWKGKFYPEKMSPAKMLPYYAQHFTSTESNYSFRTIPSLATLAKWSAATPDDFRFSFKALQVITHFKRLKNCAEKLHAFLAAITSMEHKLGAVLFQLPPEFTADVDTLRAFLDELPNGLRAAFEFRHESWFTEEVFAALRKHNAALCLAGDENLSVPRMVTADFGYLRLRRLDYTDADLEDWVKLVAQQTGWQEAFVYFKHEETAVGPRFAAAFGQIIATTEAPPREHRRGRSRR